MTRSFRSLVFDLDGTLIDGFAGIHDALTHTLQVFGRPTQDLAATKAMVGHGLELLLERALGVENVAKAVPIYRARYSEVVDEMTEALPGATELIGEAVRRGVRVGLASNKPSYFSERILKKLGWRDAFEVILGPDRVSAPKPDPAMLHGCVSALGCRADELLYVGDMTVDMETARAAGVPYALVATGNMSVADLQGAGAPWVFADLADLRRWIGYA